MAALPERTARVWGLRARSPRPGSGAVRTWELAVRVSTPQHFSIKSRCAVVEQREQSEHGRLSGAFTSVCRRMEPRSPRRPETFLALLRERPDGSALIKCPSLARCSVSSRFSSAEQCHPARGRTKEQRDHNAVPCPGTTRGRQCPNRQLGAFHQPYGLLTHKKGNSSICNLITPFLPAGAGSQRC